MGTSLQAVLGYKNLCGLIQDPKGGVPADILPPEFLSVTRRIVGDTGSYKRVEGTRRVARQVWRGEPSRRRELKGITEVPFKAITSAEHQMHDATTLSQLTNYDSPDVQRMGRAEIARQTAEFRALFNNLRVSAVHSALALGTIYFNADGELLPTGSGAMLTVDFGVPAGNRNQLDVFGGGDIIGASWATAGTNIPAHVMALLLAALKKTGYRLEYAFYGSNIQAYLALNDYTKNLIVGNPADAAAFSRGIIPDGFLELKWRKGMGAFYEDKDGVFQSWWGPDTVVFSPTPTPDWWELVEGSNPVPTNLGRVAVDAIDASSDVADVTGMASYAVLGSDPVSIKQVGIDTFIPLLKVPGAVFIADVVP